MRKLRHLQPERVFYYFEEISAIPRGSGNRKAISDYCVQFAKEHHLKYLQDEAQNVIIFKAGSCGYETASPVILQGHLDMVCQKTPECNIDFETDGITLKIDGEYLKAEGTTLGADNGIAVAMMLAILESETLSHPPIEAVFTTDEEIGMLGANCLPYDKLKGKSMINMDAEDPDTVTVSCAGGSDFVLSLPIQRTEIRGTRVAITLQGLQGGHSGIEINEGRVNADILAGRVLTYAKRIADIRLLSIDGGDKGNAIPLACRIELVVPDGELFQKELSKQLDSIQAEIKDREPGFAPTIEVLETGSFLAMDVSSQNTLLAALLTVPNGVMDMSVVIDNLVETSLNLGILKTEEEQVFFQFALRSNKKSALEYLKDKLTAIAEHLGAQVETGGYYPPWELKQDSKLQRLYQELYLAQHGKTANAVAIHAGLECAVFVANIEGLDCIAIGPEALDVHTVKERLNISSVADTYNLVLSMLEKSKD